MAELRVSSSRDRARLTGGFIAMPVVAALVAYVGFPLVEWSGRPLWGGGRSAPDAAIAFAAGVALVAIVVVPVAVVPAVLWLLRRGPVTLESTLIGGFAFGILPVVIWIAIAVPSSGKGLSAVYGVAGLIRALFIGSTIGVLCAAAFWLIVTAGRRKTA
jgi:hypothetical protein